MVRYTGPRNRIARRFGVNIFGRARNPLIHKAHPPGMFGMRRRKKSDFGLQLEEKQKLKAVYGMLTEKQLLRYYKMALRQKEGTTAQRFVELLECRLDSVVYRLRLAATPFHAQQLVAHGHIHVNGKKVDRRSFQVRPGMKVSIREKSRKNKLVQECVANTSRDIPEYLSLDADNFTGELTSRPEQEQIPYPLEINIPTVCEFLAHGA